MKEKIAALVILLIALTSFGCAAGKEFKAQPVALAKRAPEALPVPLEQITAGKDLAFAFAAEKYDPLGEDKYLAYVVNAKDRDADAVAKAEAAERQAEADQLAAELGQSQQSYVIDSNPGLGSSPESDAWNEDPEEEPDTEEAPETDAPSSYERYYNTAAGYSIDFPDGWELAETELGDYQLVSAISPPVGNGTQLLETIGVTSEELPLELTSGEYLDMSVLGLKASLEDFQKISRSDFTLGGVSGKKLVFSHTSSGAAMKGVLYEVVKGSTAYVILGAAEAATYSEYEGRFDAAAASFGFES